MGKTRWKTGLEVLPQQDLVAGLVLLGVAAGGDAGEVAEGADEMGVVGKTGALPRLLHTDPLLQQLPGPQHPAVDDILHDGKAGGRLENAAEVVFADIELAGDLVQGEGVGQVVPDIVQNGGHTQKVLVSDGLAGSGGVQGGGHIDQQVQQSGHLVDVAAEGAIVFVALQGLKQLDQAGHLLCI